MMRNASFESNRLQDSIQNWLLFPTEMGSCGIAWSEQGVTSFALPDATEKDIVKQLKAATKNP
ncbi:MAG TPA: hypothetical protein VFM46_06265, partial [Pseudomonadales bacterium]|nr:hypothetical protein [Pseudomonadales bacterium]